MKEPTDKPSCYEDWEWGHWMTVSGALWDYALWDDDINEWLLDNGSITEPVDEAFLIRSPGGL